MQEYHRYETRYGPEQAEWLMDQQYGNYKRLAMVAHKPDDLEHYRQGAQEVADYCARWGMNYEEILGSDAYVRRLVEVASALETADEEFVVVPPGGDLTQRQFLRF